MSTVRVKGTGFSNRSAVKKMIEDIQEITGHNHSDDEIHAMLKECNMDPNEAAHRLLLLDKFHEVKSKRDRRKEIKELSETKWKSGTQSRANRADAGGRMDLSSAKESGTGHLSEKGVRSSFSSRGTESVNHLNSTVNASMSRYEGLPHVPAPRDSTKGSKPLGGQDIQQQPVMNLGKSAISNASYLSSSDHALVPPQESFPHAPVEAIVDSSTKDRSASAGDAAREVGISVMEQKVPNELQEVGKQLDTLPTKSSAISSSTIRQSPPSRVTGSQKVGPVREWKPKSVIVSNDEGATRASPSEVPLVSAGNHPELSASPVAISSKEATFDLQKQLAKLSVSETNHVILPDHLHVPEIEKLGFCFGSFDASFGLDLTKHGGPGSEEILPISGSSESVDEPLTEARMGYLNESVAVDNTEAEYPEPLESHSQDPENLQCGVVQPIDNVPKDVSPGTHQHPANHASSNYNLSPVPSTLTSQFAPPLSSDSQARDAPRQPAFSVPQSVDPSSYYAQFYRSGMDANVHISPFHTSGTSMKNNGSATLVSSQAHQLPQEGGFPLILSAASPPPLVTQAAGVMQSSINPAQQPHPVFRQPSVVALPHYNYIPYGPYFSPFYAPTPTVNPFLSNALPQQLQPSSLYPTATGTTVKYLQSPYKQGSNAGAPNHTGLPGNYGAYGLSMANYSHGSATAPITSASNEHNAAPQAKENNIYASGQQNEGSGGWFGAPNREIPAVQASPFYNLPQAQLPFTPTQQGHGTFTRFLHPAQAMTPATIHHPLLQQPQTIAIPAEIGGQNAAVFQQPHHAQINWPGNY